MTLALLPAVCPGPDGSGLADLVRTGPVPVTGRPLPGGWAVGAERGTAVDRRGDRAQYVRAGGAPGRAQARQGTGRETDQGHHREPHRRHGEGERAVRGAVGERAPAAAPAPVRHPP
ncbi:MULTISPECIES: hypothetical protein [unclassified Streptomyces]|uniref:hypothetical protein n=1 Tax=unclassified Streptomyces TaxID=2593676 RepID=UPI0036CDE315|nr:hypothetical protein OG368_33060 [Streptomyces sp. NBC_01124]